MCGFFPLPLWGSKCLFVPFYPMMSVGLLVGLCWLFGVVLGLLLGWYQQGGCGAPLLRWGWRKVPKKERSFGVLLFPVGGETEEGRLKQSLRFECRA